MMDNHTFSNDHQPDEPTHLGETGLLHESPNHGSAPKHEVIDEYDPLDAPLSKSPLKSMFGEM